jgi:hypothetical protein
LDELPFSITFDSVLILDDKTLIATDGGKTWIMDLLTGAEIRKYELSFGSPVCTAKGLIVFVDSKVCNLVDITSFEVKSTIASPTGNFENVRYLPERNELISLHTDGDFRFWDLNTVFENSLRKAKDQTIKNLHRLEISTWTSDVIACDLGGNVYKVDKDGKVGTMQARLGGKINVLKSHHSAPLVAAGSENGNLFVWNLNTMVPIIQTSFGSKVTDCCFVKDSGLLVVLTSTGVHVLSLTSNKVGAAHRSCSLSRVDTGWVGEVMCDSQHIFCASYEGSFAIVDFRIGKLVAHWGGEAYLSTGKPKILFSQLGNRAYVRTSKLVYLFDFDGFDMKMLTPYGFRQQEYSLDMLASQNCLLSDATSKIPLQENLEIKSASWSGKRFLQNIKPFKTLDISRSEEVMVGARQNQLIVVDLLNESMIDSVTFESKIHRAKVSRSEDRIYVTDESGELIVFELNHRFQTRFCAFSILSWEGHTYCSCDTCKPDIEMFGQNWKTCSIGADGEYAARCSGCSVDVYPNSKLICSDYLDINLFKARHLTGDADRTSCKICGYTGEETLSIEQNFTICRKCASKYVQEDFRFYKSSLFRSCRCCGFSAEKDKNIQFTDLKFQAICKNCISKIKNTIELAPSRIGSEKKLPSVIRDTIDSDQPGTNIPFLKRLARGLLRKKKPLERINCIYPNTLMRGFLRGRSRPSEYAYNQLWNWESVNNLRIALENKLLKYPADLEGARAARGLSEFKGIELIAFTFMRSIPPSQINHFAELLSKDKSLPGAHFKFAEAVSSYPFFWYRRAEIAYSHAIELAPSFVTARVAFASFLAYKLHRISDAKLHFDIAMTVPKSREVLSKSARFYMDFFPDIEEYGACLDSMITFATSKPSAGYSIISNHATQILENGDSGKAEDLLQRLECVLKSGDYWHKQTCKKLANIREI